MQLWQLGLILLAVVWALQAVGTWMQMKHYREVMGDISRRWADGFVGAGNARGRLGKGVILILVVSPDDVVRRLAVMEGRSVMAKFKPLPEFEGRPLSELRENGFPGKEKGRNLALSRAIEQIDRTRSKASAPDPTIPQIAQA